MHTLTKIQSRPIRSRGQCLINRDELSRSHSLIVVSSSAEYTYTVKCKPTLGQCELDLYTKNLIICRNDFSNRQKIC